MAAKTAIDTRSVRNARQRLMVLAAVIASACGNAPTAPSAPSTLTVGQWSGTTAQGAPISFSVSADEVLTTITVGHSFNGCTGTETFSNVNLPTKSDVSCIPAPCSAAITSYRSFSYSNRAFGSERYISVNGLFFPAGRAEGQVVFTGYPSCGTGASVPWTATRR